MLHRGIMSGLLLLAGGAVAAAAPAPQTQTTAAGVYTAQQADAGAALYAERCALCHGATAQGTWEVPPLTGRFMGNWGHGSVGALADYIGRAMPQMAPGTLEPQEKIALVAYLLRANGMPAGSRALPADPAALAAITIEPAVRQTGVQPAR